MFLKNAPNIFVDSVSYKGSPASVGTFKIILKYNDLINSGIILTTGNITDAIGPNITSKSNLLPFKSASETDVQLSKIATGPLYNSAALTFDFITNTDSISFSFFFASEEYPEWVNMHVNDVFGFFLTDKSNQQSKNLAILPDGKTPISIDNINHLKNTYYYIPNAPWNPNNILQWEKNMALGELAYTFSFDGFSKKLTVGCRIIPNKKYRLKIIIADVGDDLFDSAVFLEAHSFQSVGKTDNSLPQDVIADLFNKELVEPEDTIVKLFLPVYFAFNSDSIKDAESFKLLQKVITVLQYDPSLKLKITGHTDTIGTKLYNKALSLRRAQRISAYLSDKGISETRLKTFGVGFSNVKSHNNDELNRRVEFRFEK